MSLAVKLLSGCPRCVYLARLSAVQNSILRRATATGAALQTRNHTQIVEREFPLPAGKDGGRPDATQMNELYKIVKEVEVVTYPAEMKCILTDFVDGIGIRGDLVTVKRQLFHDELYLAGLAVYASPENIQEFEDERKAKGIEKIESRLGVFARMTQRELTNIEVEIPLSQETSWTLDKQHVMVAFRLHGVFLEEDCITLPEETVSEFKEFTLSIMINGLESVDVKAKTVPMHEKLPPSKK